MFREISYSEGPSAAKRARVVVSNPTHIAVALSYNEESKEVPKILTMGQDTIAEEIMKIAMEENIPIMRNVELARQLYYKGKIAEYVPEDTYKAIAEILKWIKKLETVPKELAPGLFR